jgi:hypothetical protein
MIDLKILCRIGYNTGIKYRAITRRRYRTRHAHPVSQLLLLPKHEQKRGEYTKSKNTEKLKAKKNENSLLGHKQIKEEKREHLR